MRASIIVFGAILFTAGVVMGVILTGRIETQSNNETVLLPVVASAERTTVSVANKPSLAESPPPAYPDFTKIAEQSIAAVTNISSRQVVRRRSGFSNDPFFRYFFGDSQDLYGYRERPSLGSGVIVREDGYILTNAHVVGRQTAGITVTLADEREYEADLVGRDEGTDIALLRIDANNLPTVPWGDSSALRIAEWVLAVGNPFQLNQTVTLGIVSAVGRDNLGVTRYEDFIQTDAAINPGNSGGALINSRGELIGINTAIFSDTGGYQGVGFAVPSKLARRVMNELVDFGEVRRGSFGYLLVRPLTPQLAQELGTPNTNGAVIWTIHNSSSAARAGMQPGDVIVSIDNNRVNDPSDYDRLLSDAPIGSTLQVNVIRSGEQISFDILVVKARPR